jgi:hypothetical protein
MLGVMRFGAPPQFGDVRLDGPPVGLRRTTIPGSRPRPQPGVLVAVWGPGRAHGKDKGPTGWMLLVDRHPVAGADEPPGRQDGRVGPPADRDVGDRQADDRRVGDAPDLDEVQIARVVEDEAADVPGAERLDVALDVDQRGVDQIGGAPTGPGGPAPGHPGGRR